VRPAKRGRDLKGKPLMVEKKRRCGWEKKGDRPQRIRGVRNPYDKRGLNAAGLNVGGEEGWEKVNRKTEIKGKTGNSP